VTVFLNSEALNNTSDLLGGEKRGKPPTSSHRPEVTLILGNVGKHLLFMGPCLSLEE